MIYHLATMIKRNKTTSWLFSWRLYKTVWDARADFSTGQGSLARQLIVNTMDSPATPSRIIDQDFGMSITPQDLIFPMYSPNYFRPWRWYMQTATNDFGSTISDEKDKFLVSIDVQQFQPNEISVKVTDREIIIEGRHEDRQDEHGFISRQFTRRYALPKECNKDDVTSNLSSDGVLIVTASKKEIEMRTTERTVPIQFSESYAKGNITQKNVSTETDKNSRNVATATDRNSKNVSTATDRNSKNASTETCKMDERMKFEGISAESSKLEESLKMKESMKSEASVKDAQLMLKEDHSRLLKPEFMTTSDTVDKLIQESKKRTDELLAEMGQCSKSAMESKIAAASETIGESIASLTEKVAMTSEKGESSMSEMKSYSSMSSEMMSEESFSSSSSTMKATGKTSEILSEIITAELREAAENL